MHKQLAFSDDNPGMIRVSGLLDVNSVGGLRDEGVDMMAELEEPVIDLAGTIVRGSAAVALLIAWERAAVEAGKSLTFVNAPDNLNAIVSACGVAGMLAFEQVTPR